MRGVRRQFLSLLVAIMALFGGTVSLDLLFFEQTTRLYHLQTRVAVALLDWTTLLDQTSGLLLSAEPVSQAYPRWKGLYDTYRTDWPHASQELEKWAEGDRALTDQVVWVHKSLDRGLEQLDLVDQYLDSLIESLRARAPHIVDRASLAQLSTVSVESEPLTTTEAFYLSVVRNSAHLTANMMGPILDAAHERFQSQIADRVSAMNEQASTLRSVLVILILSVLLLFLFRVLKLNMDLMELAGQRTEELEKARQDQERRIAERTEELRTANQSLEQENQVRRKAEAQVVKLNRLYATLSNVNQTLVWIHDTHRLLPELCRVAVEFGRFELAWLGLVDDRRQTLDLYSARPNATVTKIELGLEEAKRNGGSASEVLQTGRPSRTDVPTKGPWGLERDHEFRSSALFPLFLRDRVVGVFGICSDDSGFFGEDDIGLLTEMAKDISFALEFMESEKKRQDTERVLQQWTGELENRVRARTRELEEKNQELDRMNRLFVGRELRMRQLKEHIKRLQTRPEEPNP